MRRLARVLLSLVALAACGRAKARPDPAPSATPSTVASAAPIPPAPPPTLALVLAGASPTVRVFASHVSVSSGAFRASADGDAPLARGDDALTALPYDPKAQDLWLAGSYPTIFEFRRDDVGEPCYAIDRAAAFVRSGATWTPVKGFTRDPIPPRDVVAWDGGMLLVDSLIPACGWATGSPLESYDHGPGTTFTLVAADGSITHPSLGLDANFIALGASSTGTDLALVGTFGDKKTATRDVVVMRRHGNGAFRASVIVRGTGFGVQSSRTRVREFGGAGLVLPPPAHDDGSLVKGAPAEGGDEKTYKGHASSIFVVTDDAVTERAFRGKSEQDCVARDAALDGLAVVAVVACPASTRLVRIAEDGARSEMPLPGASCEPSAVDLRAPGDLWVTATCGVFRLGHTQTPLRAP